MLRPSLWFVSGQNTVWYHQVYDLLLFRTPYVTISNSYIYIDCCVHIGFYQVYDLLLVRTLCYDQVYDLLLVRTLCYDQVYDLLLVRTLYVTTKFMICYWSELCMLRPSWWFVTGQNTVCYDQVYDLLLFRTPYVTISNSYIYIDCYVHIVFYQVYDLLLVRTLCYDQVYDLFLVRTLYGITKFMICYFSERHMLR
jgi:hypothetical protein